METQILELQSFGLDVLRDINQRVSDMTAKQWDHFDPNSIRSAFHKWSIEAKKMAGGIKKDKKAAISKELERGMWKMWIPRLHRIVEDSPPVDDITGHPLPGVRQRYTDVYDKPGTAVEERLNVLGITKESSVSDFGWWTSSSEVSLIVKWANSYRIQSFLETGT